MKSKRHLTGLTENTAQGLRLMGEHGLSLWLDLGSCRVLFVAGQTDIVCNLASAEAIVLSHGHHDHTGGLNTVLRDAGGGRVFAHPEALSGKYARNSDGTGRYIGVTVETRKALREVAETILTESPTEIAGGLAVTGPIPRLTDFEDSGGPFFTDEACRQPDNLVDDQAAFLETSAGTVVILGCAHSGIVNTLHYVKQLVPDRPIHTVIGGTHLVTAGEARMAKTVEELREFDIRRLLPLHCTSFPAAARLWKEFPDSVSICPVGTTLELDC